MYDFTVLILSGAYASSVAVTLDMLLAVEKVAVRLGLPTPRWRAVTPGQNEDSGDISVRLGNSMTVSATPLTAAPSDDNSIWVVPGLGLDDTLEVTARMAADDVPPAVHALRAHAARGGVVAASCSAVFVLQAAGLLRGRKVTTSWWLASRLRELEPACVVDANRMVCADGPVITAGAAFAQTDLMLHLLKLRFGTTLASTISRTLLVDGRQAQAPFVVPEMLANGDALIARIIDRVTEALPEPPSVSELAGEFGMSERTLTRHVRAKTGQSTLALVQSVRLNRARLLLESSRLSVEQVAEQVGYGDSTALWRLMRKVFGLTPSQLRTGA